MKRYALLVVAMMAVFLGLFALAEAAGVPWLTGPGPWLDQGGWIAAAVGIGLLVGDVVLPVPSTVVMIAHGALFGVALGTLCSLAGCLGATLLGFAIGRSSIRLGGGRLFERLVPADERRRADALLSRWGALAVLVTRPLPIVAETVAILAGASSMGLGTVVLAALAGSLPAALLFAVTGATAARLDNLLLVFALVLSIAGVFWLFGRRLERAARRPDERLEASD